jgi:ribose transport system permease protein
MSDAKASTLLGRMRSAANNKIYVNCVVVLVLFLAGGSISSGFLHVNHIMTILGLAAFLGIVAFGQTLAVLAGGEGLDLSVGAMVSLSSVMAAGILQGKNSFPGLALALGAIFLAGLVVGGINGLGIAFFRIPPLVMTLAMASVVGGFSIVYTNGQPSGMASPFIKTLVTGRLGFFPFVIALWILFIAASVLFLEKSKAGRKLYGVGANEVTARLSGVRTRAVIAAAYAISGLCSSLAGLLLLGYTGTPYLDVGSIYVMPSVVAVVIGGISMAGGSGSYLGVVVGAIVLTTLDSLLVILHMGAGGRMIIFGLVILVVLTLYNHSIKELLGIDRN